MKRLCLLLCLPLLAGCTWSHEKMMDQLGGVARETAARLGESGTGQIQAGGSVINPGVRVSAGVEYYANAQYIGISGQVQAAMMGDLSRDVPPEVQANIERIYAESSLSTADKFAAMTGLLRRWALAKPEPTP